MKSVHKSTFLVAAALFGLASRSALADVITIGPSKDNTLYEDPAGALSNGSGQHFFAGLNDNGDIRRGLIEFDIAGSIPVGSIVTAVSLDLYMSRTRSGDQSVGLHLLFEEWGEGSSVASGEEGGGAPAQPGDATWLHTFYSTSLWINPGAGGDYSLTASATTTIPSQKGHYVWSSAQMAADVQAWLADTSLNHGWIVIGTEPAGGKQTSKRFDSRQNADPAKRPQLTITFLPPAATGACCFADGTCAVLGATNCGSLGGSYQGNGTSCTPNPCPQPTGACCLPDGSCIETDAGDCALQGGDYHGDGTICSPNPCPLVLTPFLDPLPIPAVAVPTSGTPGGIAQYALAITQFQQTLHQNLPPTTVWGFGGTYPGPTIEAGSGLPISVTWRNDLRDEQGHLLQSHYLPVDTCLHGAEDDSPRTVIHLHGGHVPAAVDGYPESTFLPGGQVTYDYPNNQEAGTLWYHDHALGITRLNVYMGMAGFYLVRDAFEQALNLPRGEFEIALAIQDRSFNSDGTLYYPATWEEHFFGDVMLVNGKVWPYLKVKQGKYRFRILNGCNSRTLDLALSDGATFWVIGTEGGLIAAPVPVTNVILGPGERYDVVIDFEPYGNGNDIELVNSAPAPYPGSPGSGELPNVMQFRVGHQAGDQDDLPVALRAVPAIDPGHAVERTLELKKQADPCAGSMWTIDGLLWDDITERPQLGATEIWSFVNGSGVMHPMHMHLVFFQVLDRQPFTDVGGTIVTTGPPVPPDPQEAGWKDTATVGPSEILRVIAHFTDYKGRYPYHCHILEHEDHEMMRQFEVIDPIEPISYCTAGTSASGCSATLSGSGTASATAPSGFVLSASGVEGSKDGLFFFGTNGRQANPWGNGTSYHCVIPPVKRAGLQTGTGTNGLCDGSLAQDLNALWCPTCPKPTKNPGAGTTVQAQLWYRDPLNTSNQSTSLSDAIEFLVGS